MNIVRIAVIWFAATLANAGGWSNWATPTQIDLERGNGILVYGAFGNPADCMVENQIYISSAHSDYEKIFGLLLTAQAAQKEVRFYAHKCERVGWYSATADAFNMVTPDGAVTFR